MEVIPRKGLQLYAYGGTEQAQANYFDALGYGNLAFNNTSCTTPTAASFATGTSATCVADTRRLIDSKVGFWQDIYKSSDGRFMIGVELEHLTREAFTGIGGAPSTDNNVILTSLRYYFDTSANRDHRPTGSR